MPRHHYNPISVLRTFASADAWKVVKAPGDVKRRIAESDRRRIDNGQPRNWPVVVYDKSAKQLMRREIGQVCSAAELYRIPDYDDQLIRGIVRLNLREDLSLIPRFGFEALLRLGLEPLDPELIERTAIGGLDSKVAMMLPLLRNRKTITDDQKAILLRFVAFSRFRNPLFRRRYFQERHGDLVESLKQQLTHLSNAFRDVLPEEFRGSLDRLNEDIDAHVYHIAMIRYASEGFDPLTAIVNPKLKILHTSAAMPFVTCDNPSRPYHPNRLRKMFDQALAGLRDPQVHMLYPISPLSCLVFSANRSWRDFVHHDADPRTVRAINTALAMMADEEIVFAGPNVRVFQDWMRLHQLRRLIRP